MKTMKKFWIIFCSFVFALALGLGITLQPNVKAKAATSADVNITYACVEYSANDGTGVPTTYTFVASLTTSSAYNTHVYVDGQKTAATVNWGNLYIDHSAFACEVGDTFLLEIPAGTYYQTDATVANDVKLFMTLTDSYTNPNSGAYNQQGIFTITNASNIISEDAYAVQLNRKDWAMNASNAGAFYLSIVDPENTIKSGVEKDDWANGAQYAPLGNAVTVNGVALYKNIQKVYADPSEDAYMQVANVSKVGDVLTFDGWFYNATHGAFRVEKTSFIFDGKSWEEENAGSYDLEVSTTSDANPQNGFYLSMVPNHIPVSTDNSGWSYRTVPVGANHYGYYNGTSTAIKLAKFSATDWYVSLNESAITAAAGDTVSFGGWYVCTDASDVKHFIKLNPKSYQFDGTKWTETTPTISVSLNENEVTSSVLYVAPGQSASDVTATASNGGTVAINFGEAVSGDKFVLRGGESTSDYLATFSVTDGNGMIYTKKLVVRVGFEDFVMEEGAAVRVVGDDVNGLRFSAEISADTYNSLQAQGATFGMVIVPRDYITDGYELTVANLFVSPKYSATAAVGANQAIRKMLLLDNLTPSDRDKDGNYEIFGSITDILTNNLTREFVGVAYACINGEYILASYYGNDMENNARSIYYVSQKAIEAGDNASAVQTKYIDTFNNYVASQGKTYNVSYTVNYIRTRKGVTEIETETFKAPLNDVVEITAREYDGFSLISGVSSVMFKLYANKENVFDFYYKDLSMPDFETVAWHHPKLDETNNYMNDTNKAIAETMRAAGFTGVLLNGSASVGDLELNSAANIEAMKNIINMFWTYGGIQTIVSSKNSGTTGVALEKYESLRDAMATLVDCEGFGGFFGWDEPLPTNENLNKVAEYAAFFDGIYGDEATFMTNLFPSYYADWSKGDYTSYSAYIKAYCDIVLPNIVNGTKYLSMDSYPVNADGTLEQSFMYDLAVLKHYALEKGAQANAILQACGWDSDTHNVAPTEAQYRMMYYTALAFGMDSIGWWGYSPEKEEDDSTILHGQTPVNIDNTTTATYEALKAVNNEVAAFGPIFKTYTWQGVIMSSPKAGYIGSIGKDAQYDAFHKVKSDSLLSKYMLSASNTASFSSISGSGSNYVVGVMKDKNNNEAFTVVNYSAPKDNKTLSITFKANTDGQYVIYQGGEQQEVTITTDGYTLTLAPGEGAFIMSANTTHNVTFKNWDGTVLYETTCQIGNTPVYGGAEPTRDGYAFDGWTPTLGAITGDTVYTAKFKDLPYIIFKMPDSAGGEILQEGHWNFGETPEYTGETPRLDNESNFVGWTPETVPATGDAVYTAVFNVTYLVTYTNYDGTENEYEEEVTGGKLIADAPIPSLDGYIFKGWVDGEGVPFDTSTPVSSDLYLAATWYKEIANGEDSVISAEYLADNVQFENGYVSNQGWAANDKAGWYFDSDYNGVTGAGGTDDNKFMNRAQFNLTADGGAGEVSEGRETYLVLPAINYKMYSKVDFAYENSAKIKALTIYGTEVAQFGGNHKLISIISDKTGTRLEFREINSVGVNEPEAIIQLPENVINGSEGLRLDITVTGWMAFYVTELHATRRAIDYTLNMEEALAALESNPEDTDALNTYFENEAYMTEYERANLLISPAILIAQEVVNYKAVINAEAGSAEQAAAINSYKNFLQRYPQTRNEEHIAVINVIIIQNFYELEEEQVLENDPVVDTTRGASDAGERIQTGWGEHNTDYNTTYSTYVHMILFNSGDYDGTATLPAINYNACAEVYFGLRAITGGNGTVTIAGQSFSFDASKNHNWKVTIVGGVLTMTDDNKNNNDGGGVIFTATLPADVANGTTGLAIEYAFDAWSQAEITEMHVTAFKTSEEILLNDPTVDTTRGAVDCGERIQTGWGGQHTEYKTTYETYVHMIQFNSGDYDGTATLSAINYNAYEEVFFGLYAIAGGNGTVTIAGQSFSFDASKGHSWKATIIGGVLTLKDDSTGNNDGGGVIFTATLPADVANGKAGLAIEYAFDAWSQAEITEMHTISRIRKTFSAVHDNQATIAVSGSSINAQDYQPHTYWGANISTDFATGSYEKYNLAQFAEAASAYNATFTLPTFNFTQYSEAYFGIASVTAAGEATVTIAGASYTFDLYDGYVYVKVVVSGDTLTIIGDGAKNVGQVLATVTLSEEILSGKQALVVNWSTAGWSQFELSEIQTNSWIEEIK